MKNLLVIIRWIVGLLFIFSGLIKANDPLGLSYKMQEFFDVWGWQALNDYALTLSLTMNAFEVLAGVAVILAWRMRTFSWLLLLLIIFFTFLTGYALFSGKIKTCGCFGDCLPLSPLQSFIKDLVLLLLILVLFIKRNSFRPDFKNRIFAPLVLILTLLAVSFFQNYVLIHLPVFDCLPYKKGNNLLQQMKVPEGAVADSFAINFKYRKDGQVLEFDAMHFPDNFDSSYEFVDRYDKLVRKGNATPAITDLALQTLDGADTTEALLQQPHPYVLVITQNFKDWDKQQNDFQKLASVCKEKNIPLFIVTSVPDEAVKKIGNAFTILRCDATIIKTAARVNATYFLMNGAQVLDKKSYAETDEFIKNIQ